MTNLNLTRRTFLTGAGAVAAFGLPRFGAAQPAAGTANGFGPGARLAWYGETASIPGADRQLEPDANGQWVDERTGDRYSEFETPGAAAGGFVVLDLLSSEGGALVLWMTALLAQGGKASGFIDANGLLGAKSVADYWIAPAQLAALADANTDTLRILRMPYSAGGKTYNALRIQSRNGASRSQHTYDLTSGVCLASGTTAVGASVLARDTGDTLGRGAGSTSISWLRVAALRRTTLPGPGAHFPPNVQNLKSVRYTGTRSAGAVGGGAPLSMPAEADFVIASAGPTYMTARMSGGQAALAIDRVLAPDVIGSLWIDPATLGRYSRAAMIDSDALTGVTTQALGAQGAVVGFAVAAGAARRSYGYDARSGLLAQFEFNQRAGLAMDVTSMRLAQAQ